MWTIATGVVIGLFAFLAILWLLGAMGYAAAGIGAIFRGKRKPAANRVPPRNEEEIRREVQLRVVADKFANIEKLP